MNKLLYFFLFSIVTTTSFSQQAITGEEIRSHISFLTADSLAGRYPGTKENKAVVDYLQKNFKASGIETDLQEFPAVMRKDSSRVITWNVIGTIEGNDPQLKKEFIVLGAHYDHLGRVRNSIYHGADDNASGTAALLEIAEKIKANAHLLKRSVIFIGFGAEEQGLLGSAYFVEHPLVPLSQIKLMINMDMLGHLNKEQHVYMGGAGTFPEGEKLMDGLGEQNKVHPVVHAGSVAGSDHVSFYKKDISVLGIHTGGHEHYHKPTDLLEHINIEGEVKVCEYVYDALMEIASSDRAMEFIAQD